MCCLKSLSLWSFVTAVKNEYRYENKNTMLYKKMSLFYENTFGNIRGKMTCCQGFTLTYQKGKEKNKSKYGKMSILGCR